MLLPTAASAAIGRAVAAAIAATVATMMTLAAATTAATAVTFRRATASTTAAPMTGLSGILIANQGDADNREKHRDAHN